MNNIKVSDLKEAIRFLKTVDNTIKITDYKTKKSMIDFLQSVKYDFGSFNKKSNISKSFVTAPTLPASKSKSKLPIPSAIPKPPTAPLPISKPKPSTPKPIKVNDTDINIIKRKNEGQFIPFVNRTTSNIDDREFYFRNLLRYLNINVSSMNNCLEFTGFVNGKATFKIGNNIIAKNQIGTPSAYGIVYLSSFRDSDNKPFQYAIKIQLLIKQAILEIGTLETLREALLRNVTPHFPYMYSVLYCNDVREDFKNIPKDDFKKFPNLIKNAYAKKTPIAMILNELANGDLKTFIAYNSSNVNLLKNACMQALIGIFTFNMVTNHYHNDTHWGNFLYHKIISGGYIHYRIQGIDYYLENLGYLFVIWDYGNIRSFSDIGYFINGDIKQVLGAFRNKKDKGWATDLDRNFSAFNLNIYNYIYHTFKGKNYNQKLMIEYISYIFNEYSKVNWILKNIPANAKIINDKPYIINF